MIFSSKERLLVAKKCLNKRVQKKTEQNPAIILRDHIFFVVVFFFMSVPFNIGPSNTEKEQTKKLIFLEESKRTVIFGRRNSQVHYTVTELEFSQF